MTKAEIIDSVYERVGGFSKKEASEVVEAVFDAMKEVLETGQKIKVARFGNFVVRAKKQRVGRNPQTGAPIVPRNTSSSSPSTRWPWPAHSRRGTAPTDSCRPRTVCCTGSCLATTLASPMAAS